MSTLAADPTESSSSLIHGGLGTRRFQGLLRLARRRPGLVAAAAYVLLLTFATLSPTLLTSVDPLEANARHAFFEPSAEHWLGTDENGRDLLSRLIHGASASLLMGAGATSIGLVFGVSSGLAAGLGGRVLSSLIMRCLDIVISFPEVLLALVIITFWGDGLLNAILSVGIAAIPRYARLVYAQTLVIRGSSYVEAARTMGLHPVPLIWKHILPNAIKPVLLLASMDVGRKISIGASLNFLGFGSAPPTPEWGAMIATGRDYLGNAWWLTAFPGIALMLLVLSVTALGRELRRWSEAKSS